MIRSALPAKLGAIWKRDLLTAMRGSLGFGLVVVASVVELATFYFLARSVGPNFRPEGIDYFWFLLIGTAFFDLLLSSTRSLVQNLREAQISGVMEVLMTTSTPAVVIILLQALSGVLTKVGSAALYVVLGVVLFRIQLPTPNLPAVLITLVLAILLAMSMALVAAGLQVWLQRGDTATVLLGIVTGFFSGVLFPISVLPDGLRLMAQLNPFAHALTAFRLALLRGASLPTLAEPLTILAGWCAVGLPLGFLIFAFALRRSRSNGSLGFY
ncbi:MAG TPA: ABC transporter permease [Terriglobales bacterium]|nr:ABC transporter permease [Terriglobales bacterium]